MEEVVTRKTSDVSTTPEPNGAGTEERKPIWERALELARTIPAGERAQFPEDGSEQLDHYVYGTPKRQA